MRRRKRDLVDLCQQVAVGRPDRFDTPDLLKGLTLAWEDDSALLPASMVLDAIGVRTAADLLAVLRLVAADSAIAVLSWASGDPTADLAAVCEALLVFDDHPERDPTLT